MVAVETALGNGKSVVTANKALIAKHGRHLAEARRDQGACARLRGVGCRRHSGHQDVARQPRRQSDLARLRHPQRHLQLHPLPHGGGAISFGECLADAQKLGYAEADPTFDIGGFDTAHKLAILTALAFGTEITPDAIAVEGIEKITLADIAAASELGYRIKLLGVAERTAAGIEQRVHPTMVPRSSAIAQVMGVTNAVTIDADAVQELTLVGPGAGGAATASSVVADIADIARGLRLPPFGLPAKLLAPLRRAPIQTPRGRLLYPPFGLRPPGCRRRDRDAHGRARDLAGKHRSAPSPEQGRERRAGHLDYPCDLGEA